MITRLHTNSRMSQVTIFQGFVFLAGQVGEPGDSIEKQTEDTLSRIDKLLAEARSSKANILFAEVWLDDIRDQPAVNAMWEAWLPQGAAPARASGEIRVGRPGLKVEIIVIAAQAPA